MIKVILDKSTVDQDLSDVGKFRSGLDSFYIGNALFLVSFVS